MLCVIDISTLNKTYLIVSMIYIVYLIVLMNRNSIQFNILCKSHLLNTGHNTQIKQSYNNKLESHSLQNYKRLSCIIKTVSIAQIYKTLNITSS
jgi:hypothetical protein